MAKENFKRKHHTKDIIDIGQKTTEVKKEEAERAKAWIAKMNKNAKEAVIARGGKETDGKDYKTIDGAPEPRDNKFTNTLDGR